MTLFSRPRFIRAVSFLTAKFLLAFTLFQSTPVNAASLFENLYSSENPFLGGIHLPDRLGEVETYHLSPSDQPFRIYYVQDAHVSYEAQEKIFEILSYLNRSVKLDLVLLEGAAGKLDVGRLNVFDDSEKNERSWKDLLNQGLINGATQFLLHHPNILSHGMTCPQ